jgi:replication-associated recombination protein RarA
MNPKLSYFWDNGLATYLAQQEPQEREINSMPIPTLRDMHTENGLKFGEMGGYAYSYKYIEYLDQTYGWEKVAAYASGKGDYEDVFQKSEEDIYRDWCKYMDELKK